jgi:hypothetical protein
MAYDRLALFHGCRTVEIVAALLTGTTLSPVDTSLTWRLHQTTPLQLLQDVGRRAAANDMPVSADWSPYRSEEIEV